jgi:predicted nucleic acid-binding protein
MRAFFDSTVFVYAFEGGDPARQGIAQQLLARHFSAGHALVLSVQVLMETYNVLTHKKRVAPPDALAAIRLLMQHEVVAPGADAALRALELAARHGVTAFDSLIVQAALDAGCDTLYSEDLQNGRRFGALQVVNPFLLAAHELGSAGYAAPTPQPP